MALLDLLKFVTTGAWGSGLARVLTASEIDTNIYNLADAIQDIIDNPVEGVSVSNVTVVGRQVTFYMSDASTYGPFDLPVASPVYRGAWTPYDSYSAFDIVRDQAAGTFLVAVDHVAEATFDPEAADSSGQWYIQIAPPPTEKFFTIADTAFTPTVTHVNGFLNCTASAGVTVELPDTLDDNSQLTFRQGADLPIVFTSSWGTSIEGMLGYSLSSGGRGSVVTCKFNGSTWYIWGRLGEV